MDGNPFVGRDEFLTTPCRRHRTPSRAPGPGDLVRPDRLKPFDDPPGSRIIPSASVIFLSDLERAFVMQSMGYRVLPSDFVRKLILESLIPLPSTFPRQNTRRQARLRWCMKATDES